MCLSSPPDLWSWRTCIGLLPLSFLDPLSIVCSWLHVLTDTLGRIYQWGTSRRQKGNNVFPFEVALLWFPHCETLTISFLHLVPGPCCYFSLGLAPSPGHAVQILAIFSVLLRLQNWTAFSYPFCDILTPYSIQGSNRMPGPNKMLSRRLLKVQMNEYRCYNQHLISFWVFVCVRNACIKGSSFVRSAELLCEPC